MYQLLARNTNRYRGMTAADVDATDLAVIAAYLGIGLDEWDEASAAALEERVAAYRAGTVPD